MPSSIYIWEIIFKLGKEIHGPKIWLKSNTLKTCPDVFMEGADEKLTSQGKKSGFESILMGQLSHLKTKHETEKRVLVSIPEIQAVYTAIFLLEFTQLYGRFLIYYWCMLHMTSGYYQKETFSPSTLSLLSVWFLCYWYDLSGSLWETEEWKAR